MKKTIAQQQKDWEQKQTLKKQLSEFTTPELEQEILSRKQCHFGRLTCTTKAESWIITPNYQRNPVCFNCQQDLLSLKDYDK